VTVVFNDACGLKATIQSVFCQNYKNIEFVVIDGASTDGTLEIIEEYKANITFYLSEQDEGIYDAMNKGIENTHGDFVIFLNAGDVFASDKTLAEVANKIGDKDKAYFGRAITVGDKLNWLFPPLEISTSEKADVWSKKYLPNHQSIFFPRSFYATNKYNTLFKLSGDTEYKLRYLKENSNFLFLDINICIFQLGGVSNESNNLSNIFLQFKEKTMISRNYYSSSWRVKAYFHFVKLIVKYVLRVVFGKSFYQNCLFYINSFGREN
jgi:putative colanic acid biosynthesis glycosyltransferase